MNNFAFLGTDEFSLICLEELKTSGLTPRLIITAADKPKGRKLALTPAPAKLWGLKNGVPVKHSVSDTAGFDLLVVASYGYLIPAAVLRAAKYGVLNIHPSLLPRHRGPSPIPSAILAGDEKTGVTIMLLDEELDHGPILVQRAVPVGEKNYLELRDELARTGAQLLAEILPRWLVGKIEARPQDHERATFTKKIKKEDGLINLDDNPQLNLRKFRALTPWPGIYFFEAGKRIKITEAALEDGSFLIKKVIPEGKAEMDYADYLRGLISR